MTQLFCEHCGKPINPESSFCKHCGSSVNKQPLPPPAPQSTPERSSKKGSGYAVFGVIVGIISVFGGIVTLYNSDLTVESELAAIIMLMGAFMIAFFGSKEY